MKKLFWTTGFIGGVAVFLISCTNPALKNRDEEQKSKQDVFTVHHSQGSDSTGFDGEITLDKVNQSVESDFAEATDSSEDMSVAVDDYIWRELSIAGEYYNMGITANRETAWEEAQYYFEKSLEILGNLDIDTEADSLELTPEAVKYNRLLSDIVTNYRVTLLSLGHLPGDVSADALIARFSEINHLKIDSTEFKRLEEYAQEQISYNVPVIMNERVKNCILYYQTVARDAVLRYLTRSRVYETMIDSVFTEYGIPTDMKYLALVESGYNPHAYSWARAMGLWQFIASTGRLYNLNRSWWYDERKDPVKATAAAARFLKDLYEQFGSWELAMAAYNGGPGRVNRQIRKQNTNDFWKLNLRKQTMDYVPFFMAAAIISKNPAKFGFDDFEYLPQWEYDIVTIEKCLDLKTVARAVGCSIEDIQELNPELLRRFTPPNKDKYALRLPKGTREKFLAAYDDMPASQETSFVRHEIRRGETVSTIARKYGVSQYAILEANNLSRKSKIYAGKSLIVPVPNDRNYQPQITREYSADDNVYIVRSGDTVWDIARAFGTTPETLRRLNNLDRSARIYVGQKLLISNQGGSGSASSAGGGSKTHPDSEYVVKKGDTLWDIARRYGTSTEALRRINNLGSKGRIYPGQKLRIPGYSSSNDPGFRIYTVKKGDTLGEIAALFNTTVSRLKAWNGVSDPRRIQVGDKLKIYTN
nr:LysM peptidoglycan-binding domain-containing protein [candidate division Zixibacteria bacterium]